MKLKHQPPVLTPEQIRSEFELARTLPMRDKRKLFRALVAETFNTFKKQPEHSVETLELYERIMIEAIKYHAFPDSYAAGLAKIRMARFTMLNLSEPKLVSKKNGSISVDTASIAIHDASMTFDFKEIKDIDRYLLARMNEGHLFCFGTGSDGWFDVQVRVVDGPEPMLSMKEYKRVRGAIVKPGFVHIVSGKVGITDFGPLQEICLTVAPGLYKVNVFVYASSQEEGRYYIVLAPAKSLENPDYQEIETLEA